MKIVAIGGGEIGRPGYPIETMPIDRKVVSLTQKARPSLLFVGTALRDEPSYLDAVNAHFGSRLGCKVESLRFLAEPTNGARAGQLLQDADIVYVGAGDTRLMLDVWRRHSFDALLEMAAERGVVLAGLSAGGACWFEKYVTYTVGGHVRIEEGLGLVPGVFCPHYDSQEARRVFVAKWVQETGVSVLGLGERCGLVFNEGQWEVVPSDSKASCSLVSRDSGKVVTRSLVAGSASSRLVDLFAA